MTTPPPSETTAPSAPGSDAPAPENTLPPAPGTLTVEQTVEYALSQEKDHTAFARKLAIENVQVSRVAQALLQEYNTISETLTQAIFQIGASNPMSFRLRSALFASKKRLTNFVTPPAEQATQNSPEVAQ